MNHAPALIVRHRRFTLVIGVLLACLMAVAAMGVSIELHRAHAALALVLVPQIFVLVAAGMIKLAYDRWATSLVCLSVSAEGLSLPGVATRPIPWTAVRSVRGICCNPTPEHAITPRHYMLFDVETPANFGIDRPGIVRRHVAPLPAGAPSRDARHQRARYEQGSDPGCRAPLSSRVPSPMPMHDAPTILRPAPMTDRSAFPPSRRSRPARSASTTVRQRCLRAAARSGLRRSPSGNVWRRGHAARRAR